MNPAATEVLTAAQMRAVEGAAIGAGKVTGLALMERAGGGVVAAMFDAWPALGATSHRAVVLCGPGNNGGDGFVVARLLADLGWSVTVFSFGDAAGLPPDARTNHDLWAAMGAVEPLTMTTVTAWMAALRCAGPQNDLVVIDALFGTGLTRPLPDQLQSVLALFDERVGCDASHFVAVDIPSGLCADSGRALGRSLRRADLTVTFHRAKLGHFLDQGPAYCGRIVVVDIGISGQVAQAVTLIAGPHPMLGKRAGGHKYTYGHALVLSGGMASGGAARLAARGALRIGAGVVTVACPPSALMVTAAHLDAVMVRPVRDAAGLDAVLDDPRITALCLGPGMGTTAHQAAMLATALHPKGELRPLVLDADALTLLSQDATLFAALHPACILTPHYGEFARLFPDIAARLDDSAGQSPVFSKVDATRAAARRAGCTVLFKGPDTVIAAPDGRCVVNAAVYDRAAPWLATAGAGDVLAGFITGLLAQGFDPLQAAATGAWLHSECARTFGPGLIAEDLPEEVPTVFRSLGV
jgi:hydroxyethylthiazole kinase-like uncharacterized protein yjeF